MGFLVLHADRLATLVANDPVVPASRVSPLLDAAGLLGEASRLRDEAAAHAEDVRVAAHAEGRSAGAEQAREAGEAEWRAALFRLALQAGEEGRKVRGEIARLAIEVVRQIAGEVGEPAFLAALAERATASLTPEANATVRVPPAALAAVQARIGAAAGLAIEADAALGPLDCTIETPFGSTHAGLEVQLGQLERAWAEVGDGR